MFARVLPCLALLGCSASPYKCESNAQCIDGSGASGICELDGYCSFPDSKCPSGERYDQSAGGPAGTCVAQSPQGCVQSIAVGIQFTCMVRSDGTVWCWGNNADGEVGDGTVTDRSVPTKVLGLPDASSLPAVAVTAAEEHACALIKDGSVWCWGINDTDNLGQCDSSITNSTRAVKVPKWNPGVGSGSPTCVSGSTFTAALPSGKVTSTLTAGGEHTCAVGSDGQLYCWGENTTGDEGGEAGQDFTALPNVPGPLVVNSSSAFTNHVLDLQAGDDFTCMVKDDNSAWCWGGNQLGELANGGTTQSITPVAINGFGDVGQLLVDDETGCVLTKADGVWCWGNGSTGIFGPAGNNGDNATVATNLVAGTALFGGPTSETLCLSNANGALQCWGDNGSGEGATGSLMPVNVTDPTDALISSVTQLRIGQYHACALTGDGSLWCWGDDAHGELGNNQISTTPNTVPSRVSVTCP
ncbi:MAG TPA: hypothetical protein VLX92_21195 [Kofleriaceae bacterium]|nr:hypothetical protein [Kofleriaceae bacterium]